MHCDHETEPESKFADFQYPRYRYAKRVVVGAMYRLPQYKMNSSDHLEAMSESLPLSRKGAFILGDLNCNMLKASGAHTRLNHVLNNYPYRQCVTQPAWITDANRARSVGSAGHTFPGGF